MFLSLCMALTLLDRSVQAHSGVNLALAFSQILDEYEISEKVCISYLY